MAQLDNDARIQQAVLQELWWSTQIMETKIGVTVEQGVVTLLGVVDSFTDRWFAQEAAHSIAGVRGVANELQVRTSAGSLPTNTEIVLAARRALELSLPAASDKLRVTVSAGWVTLEGRVNSMRECAEAEAAVRQISGVRGVKSRMAITLGKVCSALPGAAIATA